MIHNNSLPLIFMATLATTGGLCASQLRHRAVAGFSASSSSATGGVAGAVALESRSAAALVSNDSVTILADKIFNVGKHYLDQGNAPVAIFLFQQASELGNAKAFAHLGDIFRSAEGVQHDGERALEYYQRAAKAGIDDVYSDIGTMYLTGEDGVTQSTENALYAFQKGSAKGDLWSTYYLGHLYLTGAADMEKDGARAVQYFNKVITALSGNAKLDSSLKKLLADAYYACFYLYENGIGVEKDQKRSREYAYKAAQNGSTEARDFLL